MSEKKEFVSPRVIDFTLSKWEEGNAIQYIAFYNGLYIGCTVKADDMTNQDIAKAIIDIELTKKLYSRRLSKIKCIIKDKTVVFYISGRRVEVSYALPKK